MDIELNFSCLRQSFKVDNFGEQRLCEIRARSIDQQRYRAIGINLVTAATVSWN